MSQEQNGGKFTFTIESKTFFRFVVWIISVLISAGAIGYGGMGNLLGRDVPSKETVDSAASAVIGELKQIRREMNHIRAIQYQVEDHAALIDSLRRNQQRGFGALWYQNRMIVTKLDSLTKISSTNRR